MSPKDAKSTRQEAQAEASLERPTIEFDLMAKEGVQVCLRFVVIRA